MADAQNSARVSTAYYGNAPYPNVAVSQQAEWFFGQSWPSLVYLPGLALTSSTERVGMLSEVAPFAMSDLNEFAKTVGWHEMAHQWWGHMVGWESYRDQWLSEGFAEFTYEAFLERKRESMMEKQAGARLAGCDSGPISNGFRLSTRANPRAVSTIVYDKGAWVLHMIRMMLADTTKENPDAAFMAMMHEFVSTYDGRNPSTADFQKVLERHMNRPMNATGNGRMDYFFDQWVHGTDIPKLHADLRIDPVDGKKYRISGTVSQSEVPDDFITVVPLYIDFGKAGMARVGFLRLEGSTPQPVSGELSLPSKPKALLVNAKQDILVR
jgi:aminopeptidase N